MSTSTRDKSALWNAAERPAFQANNPVARVADFFRLDDFCFFERCDRRVGPNRTEMAMIRLLKAGFLRTYSIQSSATSRSSTMPHHLPSPKTGMSILRADKPTSAAGRVDRADGYISR